MTAATLQACEATGSPLSLLGVYQRIDSRATTPLGYELSGNTPMGKRSQTGGITAVGTRRIRFDFFFEGQRYRPSILHAPTDLNLRRAREQLAGIKERMFAFADEFPNFRDLKSVPDSGSRRTCSHVFDAFLAHCESRVTKDDMAPITVSSYRRVLNTFWRPKIGEAPFLAVRHSMLVRSQTRHPGARKPTTTRLASYAAPSSLDTTTIRIGTIRHLPSGALESERKTVPPSNLSPSRTPRQSSQPSIRTGARRRGTTTSSDSSPDCVRPSRSPCSCRISTRRTAP
jgi:Arm DNA-binding domain